MEPPPAGATGHLDADSDAGSGRIGSHCVVRNYSEAKQKSLL